MVGINSRFERQVQVSLMQSCLSPIFDAGTHYSIDASNIDKVMLTDLNLTNKSVVWIHLVDIEKPFLSLLTAINCRDKKKCHALLPLNEARLFSQALHSTPMVTYVSRNIFHIFCESSPLTIFSFFLE